LDNCGPGTANWVPSTAEGEPPSSRWCMRAPIRMNRFQYSGPTCRAQSASDPASDSKVMGPCHDRPTWSRQNRVDALMRALGGSCFQYSSCIRSVESPKAGEPSSNARGEKQKGNRRDLPDQRLGGGAAGGSRPPVTGCPVLRGLEHRVIGATETLSTAYRAEQYEPQKVFLEEIAGAGAVALKAATVLTSKLTGSHI
jgi:hypothetical protein